ncbi:unnamed protein product [Cochlearia groenlandica]
MEQKQPTTVGDEEMAAEKPLNPPALQKPPGFREQQDPSSATPPGTATLPRLRPRPPSFYPENKRRSSRCGVLCCCVCIVVAVILLLLIIAVAVFFIWYNPKLPVIRLAAFKISNFNFSGGKTNDDGWSFLTSNATAMLNFRNRNGKLTFYYGDADVAVILGEKDFETNLGSTKVKGFIGKPGNRTDVIIQTIVRNRQVDDPTAKRLRAELKSKRLLVKVTAKTKIGLAVGSRRFVTVDVSLKCGRVRLQTLDTKMTKCTIKILKWYRSNCEHEKGVFEG